MSVLVLLYCASFFLLIFLLDSLEYMACTVFKGSSWSKKLILLAVYQVIASNTSLYSLPIFSQPKLYNSRWSQNTFSYPASYTIQSVQRKCSTGYMLLFYLFYFIYVCCTCMGFFVRICFSSFFLFFSFDLSVLFWICLLRDCSLTQAEEMLRYLRFSEVVFLRAQYWVLFGIFMNT